MYREKFQFETPALTPSHHAALDTIMDNMYRCPEKFDEGLAAFKRATPDCRNQKHAFVYLPNQLELGRRMLNQGQKGEPYKIWRENILEDRLVWHTSHSA